MLYFDPVESFCAKLVLKIENRIAINEIFFNIVIDFNFIMGTADGLFSEADHRCTCFCL
jgi:hypothetical protein